MSILNINKSFDTIMAASLERLAKDNVLTEISRGGVARLLLAVFNEEFARNETEASSIDGFYDILKNELVKAFLSYATGDALDAIGYMLNCNRSIEEADDRYRWRISQQTLNLATANETAVRLAALSVAEVDDVTMKAYTHGTGSGSIYIVNKDPDQLDNLIDLVKIAVAKVGAWGTRIEVFKPRFLEVKANMRLVFYKDTTELDQRLIRTAVADKITTYLKGLNCGDNLDVTLIKEMTSKTSGQISEEQLYYLSVNNSQVLPVTQSCSWNERFIPCQSAEAVVVS